MKSIIKGSIEYTGITDHSELPTHPTSFKHFTVLDNLTIPETELAIAQIIRVMAEITIISTKIIKTPIGTSLEGQILTGWKGLTEGAINQKIEYVADEPNQPVHVTHFKVPFSTLIVLPATFTKDKLVTIIPYIEDISTLQIDKRTIFNNVTILLDAIIA